MGLRRGPRPAGTAPPSAAPSPPTPAGSASCATATPGPSWSGVEAVLGTGDAVSHLGGLLKDNTGYDLAGAAVRERGHPRRGDGRPAPARAPGAGSGWSPCWPSTPLAAGRRRRRVPCAASWPPLDAAELFLADGLDLVGRVDRWRSALRPPARRLPAGGGGRRTATRRPSWPRRVDSLGRGRARWPWPSDPVRAAGPVALPGGPHRGHQHASGAPHKLDVTLPLGSLAEFIERVPGAGRRRRPGGP